MRSSRLIILSRAECFDAGRRMFSWNMIWFASCRIPEEFDTTKEIKRLSEKKQLNKKQEI